MTGTHAIEARGPRESCMLSPALWDDPCVDRVRLELAMSPASDFWTLSDCWDLLFHVNEHRFALPQIGELLSAASLEFLGARFGHEADEAPYLAENPRPGALRDREALHRHELQHPEVFGDTYRLWARPRRPTR